MTTPGSKFDRSALPVPRHFYEPECGKLSRTSRGWARSRCPLHGGDNPSSFSVNIHTGGFYCHACGAKGGDVVAFMEQRYKLSFKEAAEKLGAWGNSLFQDWKKLNEERQRAEQAAKLRKQLERSERIRARDHLHTLERRYAEATAARDVDLLSTLLPVIRQAEEAYWTLSGMEVRHEQ
jgi:DNA primase